MRYPIFPLFHLLQPILMIPDLLIDRGTVDPDGVNIAF